jgi:hypothetical protein
VVKSLLTVAAIQPPGFLAEIREEVVAFLGT